MAKCPPNCSCGRHTVPGRPPMDPYVRFWSKVKMGGWHPFNKSKGHCLIWTGAVQNGYGVFTININKVHKTKKAHKWIFEYEVCAVPDGFELDHTCRVRRCINPVHMKIVTKGENWEASRPFRVLAKSKRERLERKRLAKTR